VADPRLTSLARVLVNYSLKVKKGEWVQIEGPYIAQDLIRAAYAQVLAVGGNPTLRVSIPGTRHHFFKHAGVDQLKFVSPLDKLLFKKVDKLLFVRGDWNNQGYDGDRPPSGGNGAERPGRASFTRCSSAPPGRKRPGC